MATKRSNIGGWVRRALRQEPPRSKSLIVTIFGDSIAPYASGIWLSELIALLHPFQVNERLVRTSAFRLAEEGWLESRRDGRLSRYSLTPSGLHRINHAYRRIYDPPLTDWDGNWTLAILNKGSNSAHGRMELRRELSWEGFGLLASGIFLHPCADLGALRELLDRLKLTQNVVVLQARDLATVSSCPVTTLVAQCWNLDLVAERYARFLDRFGPALPLLRGDMDPQTAFIVQTLLIHSFRRVVLHDPRLPAALLPKQWPGHSAYELCREIYRLTFRQTQTYLASHLEEATNRGVKPNAEFRRRFGDLGRS